MASSIAKGAKGAKGAYPSKTHMNLYYKVDRTTRPATVILYILFVLALLLALAKFGVYDLQVKVDDGLENLNRTKAQLAAVQQSLADYDDVAAQYSRYSYGYLSADEAALADRMEALALLEDELMDCASVSTVTINGNTVAVQFSGLTLEEVAELVMRIEARDMVRSVSVSTAVTQGEGGSANTVSASMSIDLVAGWEGGGAQ